MAMITINEAAEILGVSRPRVSQHVSSGAIRHKKRNGKKGRVLLEEADVHALRKRIDLRRIGGETRAEEKAREHAEAEFQAELDAEERSEALEEQEQFASEARDALAVKEKLQWELQMSQLKRIADALESLSTPMWIIAGGVAANAIAAGLAKLGEQS
jgi:excisionase family DNA binding protein